MERHPTSADSTRRDSSAPPTRVVVLSGPPRRAAFNAALANTLPALAPKGMTIGLAPAWADLPTDPTPSSASLPVAMALENAILASSGVILVSPEADWSTAGELGHALRWLAGSPHAPLANKPVLLMSATSGPLGGAPMLARLRERLVVLRAAVCREAQVTLPLADRKFHRRSMALVDDTTIEVLRQQLVVFHRFVRRSDQPR